MSIAIDEGNPACTSGMSQKVYDGWTGDPANGFISPLPASAVTLLKAQCYRWCKGIAEQLEVDLGSLPGPGSWAAATLINGWANVGTPFRVASYRKDGDCLSLSGVIADGSGVAFILPAGSRPTYECVFPVDDQGNHGQVWIKPNGEVTPSSTGGYAGVSLDGVRFFTN